MTSQANSEDESREDKLKKEDPETKLSKKQALLKELKTVAFTMLYLAIGLSILETYKSLILLQQGINEFGHNYVVAIVEAICLGKIVALTENLPFMKACKGHSLARAVIYQSFVMTLIVDAGGALEDKFFTRAAKLLAESGDPTALIITHQVVSMSIL